MPYKILFFGTSEFAVPSLRALMDDERFEIVGIVTQPDRPVGRHAELTEPPVKRASKALGIQEIRQPEKIKDEDFQTWIKNIGPSCDAFVIVSYGKILPQWLLDLPKKGVINVHGSLLPRWRGASPIQAAIAAGDTMSGVSVMLIDAEMDHGPLLATAEEPIRDEDTGGSLHDRLAVLGGKILPDVLASYLEGKTQPTEQDHTLATSCKILSRDDGKLDFTKTSQELEWLVRAYNPWPGTWMEVAGKRLKILQAKIVEDTDAEPGALYAAGKHLLVACTDNTALELITVQPEGKKAMSGEEYTRGIKT
ncbi:MAG: methionyl-tRNA formyltransferase [Patescibacteria group bacterium]